MHKIDASFREQKQRRRRKRRAARLKLAVAIAGSLAFVGLAVGLYVTRDQWSFGDLEAELEPAEFALDEPSEERPIYVPAIVDLAGDPMIIQIGGGAGQLKTRSLPRPDALIEDGIADRITLLVDEMLSSSERFMTTLPSSQEDFAFFQAQRQGGPQGPDSIEDYVPPPPETRTPDAATGQDEGAGETGDGVAPVVDAAAGWGETLSEGQAALPDFKRTRIENTTSVAYARPEAERFQTVEDIFVKVLSNRTLDSLVLQNRFTPEDAKTAGEAMAELMQREELKAGDVVAMRGFRRNSAAERLTLAQVSIYSGDDFLGTLARADDATLVLGADPWVKDDLFNYSGQEQTVQSDRKYRLLDAIYSTAARNNVPTSLIGEAIMLLSRSHDLDAFASYDDRMVLLFTEEGRGGSATAGRILYVAVRGAEKSIECYVYKPQDGNDFICMDENTESREITVRDGMVTPVNGVLTSTFGPRRHPILKTVRIHKGVDWAAPTGTPVMAAYDGKVVSAGDGKGYGNLVRVAHSGGRETRYAHLSRFSAKARPGTQVKAGDVIGYVGTTGLSTGPHLHFELHQGSRAIDPLASAAGYASDGSAADILTDKIIRVESAGDPRAKNPLSTATGLGQFIESTWLRMMRTYRPDLARSLSRAELLDLRFDPTISREMVRNLAREGESYLRSRGHSITAGRLYLAHFLGMDGAHVVLSSPRDAMLLDVLGAAVIKANPFLTGRNVDYVINWAERKMRVRGRGRRAPTVTRKRVARVTPEFVRFRTTVQALVQNHIQGS